MRRTLEYTREASALPVPQYPVALHWLVAGAISLDLLAHLAAIVRLFMTWDARRVYGVMLRTSPVGPEGALFGLVIMSLAAMAVLYVVLFRSHETTHLVSLFYGVFSFIRAPFPLAIYLGKSSIGEEASLAKASAYAALHLATGVLCVLYYRALRRLLPASSRLVMTIDH